MIFVYSVICTLLRLAHSVLLILVVCVWQVSISCDWNSEFTKFKKNTFIALFQSYNSKRIFSRTPPLKKNLLCTKMAQYSPRILLVTRQGFLRKSADDLRKKSRNLRRILRKQLSMTSEETISALLPDPTKKFPKIK